MISILILIAAFLGSILAGLFGGGAGLIFTPTIFMFLSHANPTAEHLMQTSITTMITSMLLSGLIAIKKHSDYKHIDWAVVKWSSSYVVLGSILGCYLMTLISSKNLTYIFATATLVLAIRYTVKLNSPPTKSIKKASFSYRYLGSLILGLVSTISGAASFAVPYYEHLGLDIKKAIGTTTVVVWVYSVIVAVVMIVSGLSANNLPQGNVGFLNYSYLWLLIIPTIPGTMLGAKLSHKLPEKILKISFIFLLICIGIGMFFKV